VQGTQLQNFRWKNLTSNLPLIILWRLKASI